MGLVSFCRAIAVDYDGTLTQGSTPDERAVAALSRARARASSIKLILVTGRTMAELVRVFPSAPSLFDAIVAENGLVLHLANADTRLLAPPLPATLEEALRRRNVFVSRGDVLFATEAQHDAAVLEAIGELGLDCQIVRNRSALMILPAGKSKGTGLGEALGELGVSLHNVIGVGDAENDHALLEACEIGVAVSNAIPSLKAHADIVLEARAGEGVAKLVDSIVEGTFRKIVPNRWRVTIGTKADGTQVDLPASGINVLIAGGSGAGKSFLAGLLAERLLQLGYSLCVLDPEGDHTQLGELRGTVTLGGLDGVPPPSQLGRLLQRRFGGAIVNLSLLRSDERVEYTHAAIAELEARREATGLPHWVFLDEAHAALGETSDATVASGLTRGKGYCLVTYHPIELLPEALAALDVVFLLPQSVEIARGLLSQTCLADAGISMALLEPTLRELGRGEAVMIDLRTKRTELLQLGRRRSPHVRHKHKYVHAFLPPRHHFYFRDERGPTGRYAANLEDFHRELQLASDAVLAHHARAHDFSRWIGHVLQDPVLALDVRTEETAAVIAELRAKLVAVLDARYGDDPPSSAASSPGDSDPPSALRG